MFNDTITVYKKTSDVWARESILVGVHFNQKIERVNDGGKNTFQTVTTVTIPAEITHSITADGNTALVLGTAPAISGATTIKTIRTNYPTFCIVNAIKNNARNLILPHWKVIAT